MSKPPPITKGDNGQGERRNRFGSAALKMVYNNEIMPYWAPFTGHTHSREALERWGVAEFRRIPGLAARKRSVWYGRLTARGVQVRDDYARRRAEIASKRRHK